jgi:hypothetical protein
MNCSAFFVEDPSILVKEISDFFPFHARARRCTSVALNSFTRFGLLLGIILSVIKFDLRYLVISMLFPLLAAAAWYGMQSKHTIREGFAGNVVAGTDAANKVVADVIGVQERTLPNAPNPFMSVLSNEINNNDLYLFITIVITRIKIDPNLSSFQSFKIYELRIISKPILILDDNIKVSDNSIYNIESINTKKLYLNDVPINSLTELNSNALMSALDDFKNQYSYY